MAEFPLYEPRGGWSPVEKFRRWAIGRIRRLPYGRELKGLLVRYADALDERDLNVAVLKMWSILERLTGTDRYDDTVRRTVWGFLDPPLAIELLNAVRLRRNRFVHAASSSSDADQVAYLGKRFIDPLLLRFLKNEFRAESFEEIAARLALPESLSLLQKQKDRASYAIRILKRRQGVL